MILGPQIPRLTECPADAIFYEADVPAESRAWIAANAAFFRR